MRRREFLLGFSAIVGLPVFATMVAEERASAQLFGAPAQPTVASTVYIDPTAGGGGNGTFATPYNTWAGHAPTGNIAYLQKAGTTYAGEIDSTGAGTSMLQPCIIGCYDPSTGARITDGSQTAAINAAGKQQGILISHNNFWIDSLEVYGANLNGTLNRGIYSDTTVTTGLRIQNCSVHDIAGTDSGNIYVFGHNTSVLFCTIFNGGGEGIFGEGNNFEVGFCNISNISTDGATGDCIQLSDDVIATNNCYLHNNTLDHTNKDVKQCIIVACATSSGGLIQFNTCTGFTNSSNNWCIEAACSGLKVFSNRLINGGRGVDIGTGVGTPNGVLICGNIITNTSVVSNTIGIRDNGATNTTAINNVIVNTTGTFTNSTIGVSFDSTCTGSVARNNIIQGWKTGGSATAGHFTDSNNNFFGCQSNGFSGTGTITTDPLFVGGGNYNLQAGSGAKGAGVNPGVPAVVTFTGKVMQSPFDMGAYWASSP